MFDEDIIKIEVVQGARIQNTHNDYLFPWQNLIRVYFRNGKVRVLDLFCRKDITNIDYFSVVNDRNVKILFEERKN